MSADKYQLVFQGQILPGFELSDVKQRMAKLFKTDLAQIEKLFCGQRIIVKDNLDQATAQKYLGALKAQGADCEIKTKLAQADQNPHQSSPTPVPQSPAPATPDINKTAGANAQNKNAAHHQVMQTIRPQAAPNPFCENDEGMDQHLSSSSPSTSQATSTPEQSHRGALNSGMPNPGEQWHKGIDHFDTGELTDTTIAQVGVQIVPTETIPEANIDTHHLSMSQVGETLVEPEAVEAPEIDTSRLSLDESVKSS